MKSVYLFVIACLIVCTGLQAQTTLQIGDKAPAFSAKNQNGKTISLNDYAGRKVILYFYPKDNTPGCTSEACNLRDNSDSLLVKGYVILGVSVDNAASHQDFIKQNKLPYDLLVDEDAVINKKYGVWVQKERDGKVFYGTARTTFVIDEQGVITKVISKVDVNAHAAQILEK